jgi:hypothetical protein
MPDPARLIAELRRLALVAAETSPGMRCRVCGSRWPFAEPRKPSHEKHEADCLLAEGVDA